MHHIRPFESSDAPAVAAIAATAPQIAQWSANDYAQLLSSGYMAWVAAGSDAAELIGFIVIRLIPPEAEILNLAVAPALREAGIGSDLLAAALRHLSESGAKRLFLEVRPSNTAAISFYQKHLFTLTGIRPNYYQRPPEAALLMSRAL
jgi:[ribosomal protein S18]-alanine N-acetyltransferase